MTGDATSDDRTHLLYLVGLGGDLLCTLDLHGTVRHVEAGLSLLGYAEGDLVGRNLLELVHADDAVATAERLRGAIVNGPALRVENRCRAKDGDYRWLTWLVSRRATTYAAVIRDATERKWIEHELEASLSLVEATLDSTADGLLVADKDGHVVTFNRKFLDMWGMTDTIVFSGTAETDDFCDLLLSEAEGHVSMARELQETPAVERYEALTLKDGRVFERYSRPRLIRDAVQGRVWSFRDVTERVRAERELREHLSMGIEHAVEGIGRLDAEGRYVSANAVLTKILGYDGKEIIGKEWGAACPPEDRARVVAARQAVPPGGKAEIEGRAVHRDGSIVPLRALIVRADGKGRSSGYHVFMRDITEQKEMQERLLLADRMASMGTLAAGVAHELNNPLAFVIANIAVLTEILPTLAGELEAKKLTDMSELLSDVRDGADRVRRIVRDLKMFSRPDDTKTGAVDVRQVLESSVNMAWNEIRHRARLVKDYGAGMLAEGNDAQLGQVFLNLLINAAQAIPEGNVEGNEIRIVTSAAPDGHVVIEIRDTGAGIPPAVLPRIFDPFFTTKAVGVGTGLGLSVCHGIVTKLGGEIEVESTPGSGTTFRVRLRGAAGRPTSARPRAHTSIPPPPAERRRILVVDDEVMIGSSLRRVLGKDYDVAVCTSGREALATLTGGARFDVILCDIMMPDVTGMDVYEELQRAAPDVAKRIVFMTGGIFTPRAKAFFDQVPNKRLEKPIDVKSLRAWMRDLMQARE